MANPWNEIFLNDFEAAYRIADQNFIESAEEFDLRARAISALLLENYESALKDFLLLLEIDKHGQKLSDGNFLFAGLCFYALGRYDEAFEYFSFPVANWKMIKYTTDYLVPPCILYYIALKMSQQDLLKIAIKRLKKLKPEVPKYLLGELGESDLNESFKGLLHSSLAIRTECKLEFYKSVWDFKQGNTDEYLQHLRNCIELKGNYLEFHYYLAKIEVEKMSDNKKIGFLTHQKFK